MPYTVPTAAQFKERFPIFIDQPDTLVDLILAEAASQVDTSWIEADYQPAIMYAAAHLLATDNSAEGEDPEVGDLPGPIASESFGEISVSYRAPSAASQPGSAYASFWGTTEYGRRFLRYARQNKPGVVAI